MFSAIFKLYMKWNRIKAGKHLKPVSYTHLNVVIAAFLILGTISYQVTGGNDLLRIILFLAACKGEDMIRCLKMVFWITLIGCTGIILLSISGIYGAATLTQDFGRGGVETRYVLGMGLSLIHILPKRRSGRLLRKPKRLSFIRWEMWRAFRRMP